MYVPVVFLTNKTLTVGHHQMSQSVDLWNQAPGLQIKGPSDKIIMLIHSCYIILLWYTFFYISVHNRSFPDILANFNLLRTLELMFFDLHFQEFMVTINFPCSKSCLRIGENLFNFLTITYQAVGSDLQSHNQLVHNQCQWVSGLQIKRVILL